MLYSVMENPRPCLTFLFQPVVALPYAVTKTVFLFFCKSLICSFESEDHWVSWELIAQNQPGYVCWYNLV